MVLLGRSELDSIDPGSVDVFLVFSVIQYLTEEELTLLFRRAARLLSKSGVLILGDVIPPETQLLTDLKDFLPRGGGLRGAAKRLLDSLLLARSDYPGLRRRLGLRRFGDELGELLAGAGFDASRHSNFGPNQSRSTWLARPTVG